MLVCASCDGFVPDSMMACPHCEAKLEGRTTRALNPIVHGIACAAVSVTLMACYGGGPEGTGSGDTGLDSGFTTGTEGWDTGSDPVCEPAPTEPIASDTTEVSGSTQGGSEVNRGSCGGDGVEQVFTYTPPAPGTYEITLNSAGDGVLYVRQADCGEELACNDDDDDSDTPTRQSRVVVELDGSEVEIVVDSFYTSSEPAGAFDLTITPQ